MESKAEPGAKGTDMQGINHLRTSPAYAAAMISAVALETWTTLYLAVGICAALCATIAAIATTQEVWAGTWRPALVTRQDKALALPRLWLRWQIKYLTGAPVILAIALLYAQHLGFGKLAAV